MLLPVVFKKVKGNLMTDHTASHGAFLSGGAAHHLSILSRIGDALAVWRQRRTLVDMPEHLRKDVGLTESDILRETRRPLWDVPQVWRR
jgi:uncharacterized protein YjiS (DUF1127 family)